MLTDFLLARIAEDEAAAKAVPPLGHNYDMGGNRQDERFTFGRTLPSSADGMGNWSPHRDSPTTRAHFARHDPARVLRRCEADRAIVERLSAVWAVARTADDTDLSDVIAVTEWTLKTLALPYADHPDHRDEWKP